MKQRRQKALSSTLMLFLLTARAADDVPSCHVNDATQHTREVCLEAGS